MTTMETVRSTVRDIARGWAWYSQQCERRHVPADPGIVADLTHRLKEANKRARVVLVAVCETEVKPTYFVQPGAGVRDQDVCLVLNSLLTNVHRADLYYSPQEHSFIDAMLDDLIDPLTRVQDIILNLEPPNGRGVPEEKVKANGEYGAIGAEGANVSPTEEPEKEDRRRRKGKKVEAE